MSQVTLSERPYVNSNLFSGHYLDERIQERDEWDCDNDARQAMNELQSLYELEGELVGSYGEDALIDNWIDEVLDVLGFGTQEEVTLPGGGGFVDELLFESPTARRDAAGVYLKTEDTTDLFERGIGIVEAKQWDAAFNVQFSEQRPYRNASHQTKHYLENTPSNIQWGVLTNGRKWRLYGTNDYETKTYYEVDLPELLERNDLEAFKYFYVFFRPAAFHESGGTTFHDEVWSESETASQELGENLQDNVFTALRVLGRGFVETNDGLDIDPDDEESLDELKEQSLVFLYRLMFVLYAEARGLIHPEGQSAQDEYDQNFSLDELRLDIHETIGEVDEGFEDEFSDYSTTMWSRLEDLFRLIDEGEEDLGIPPYNGGLFDHEAHDFLTDHEVSNQYLAEVIYRLSTTQNDEGRYVLADYADLDTRHLGSVYEGLLEHQFRIAPEQYAAVAEDSGQVWKPATDVSVADAVETVPKGGLYVVNDQGERKATGAYYTPDYVVTYIVEETVGPLVEEIREDLIDQGFEPGTQEYIGPFFRRVTDLRILDPAMGSGHFLTKVTGYLSEQVMSEVREAETEFGVAFDEQHIRREIAKECIYGVDLNGMAVELAKLSMWLETLAADRPLAFLDHHFKQGNSLVGSDIEAIEELESDASDDDDSQASLAEFGATREGTIERLMDIYSEFLAIENETVEDVHEMKRKYAEIEQDELRKRLVAMANVHTAERFGLDVPSGAYERMAKSLEDDTEWVDVEGADWYESAQTMSEDWDFLHWKLAFPEAFYEETGEQLADAGFDAVVGNPPYVRMEEFKQLKEYLEAEYVTHSARTDLYVYFMERTVSDLLRTEGEYGVIVSNKFMRANYGASVRSLLASETNIREIVDFGGLPVFPDATVRSAVLFIKNTTTEREQPVYAPVDSLTFTSLSSKVESSGFEVNPDGLQGGDWRLVNRKVSQIMEKVENKGTPLNESLDTSEICRGIVTGRNEAFFIDDETRQELINQDPDSEEVIEPMVRGENIRRYHIRDRQQWMLYMGEGVDIERYPAVEQHLRQYKEELEGRATEQPWYELQQPQGEYVDYFDSPKVVYPEIAPEARFAFDDGPLYPNNKCFFLPTEEKAYVPLLNSTLSVFYLSQVLAKLEGSSADSVYYEFRRQYMKELPIVPAFNEVRDKSGSSLSELAETMADYHNQRESINLDLLDYIGSYSDGPSLTELGIYQPPEGVGGTKLAATKEDYGNLRVGTVTTERKTESTVIIHATARYKPDDEDAYETDQWGYTETEPIPAMRLTNLSETEAALVEAFVPVAVEEAGGFAGFRETATKTNSLVDRLEAITLPDPDDVADGIERYREAVERAEELDEKILRTDDLIDKIVYDLYELTDEEIEIVEETVADD